jgi:hypothetical protein
MVSPKVTSTTTKVATFRTWLLAEAAEDLRRLKERGPPGTGSACSLNEAADLRHIKIESTVCYLGVDVEDALTLAERAEV